MQYFSQQRAMGGGKDVFKSFSEAFVTACLKHIIFRLVWPCFLTESGNMSLGDFLIITVVCKHAS